MPGGVLRRSNHRLPQHEDHDPHEFVAGLDSRIYGCRYRVGALVNDRRPESRGYRDNRICTLKWLHCFHHDLDFGTILALTHAAGPSVIQVRTQDILPSSLGSTLISVVRDNKSALDQGALSVVDEARARVRILPLQRSS